MLQVTYNIYERKNKETSSANTLTQITGVYTGKETILLVDKLFTGFYSNYYLILQLYLRAEWPPMAYCFISTPSGY